MARQCVPDLDVRRASSLNAPYPRGGGIMWIDTSVNIG